METLILPTKKHMKKTIQRTGQNGTFTGYVEVLFNHRTEDEERPIKGTERKPKFFHVVRGTAEQLSWIGDEFTNKEDAVAEARKMEDFVTQHLHDMATRVIEKGQPVEENLKNLGYV